MTTTPTTVAEVVEVFCDTETTHRDHRARPWEITLIPREHPPAGPPVDTEIILQITDVDLTDADPEALDVGRFWQRHIVHGSNPPEHVVLPPLMSRIPDWTEYRGRTVGVTEAFAAVLVTAWTTGGHLIGVNTQFDMRVLTAMLARHGIAPAWHYHPRCVADHAAGYLAGVLAGYRAALTGDTSIVPDANDVAAALAFPRYSTRVLRLAGIEPPAADARHTAYGDTDWARRAWDRLYAAVPRPMPPQELETVARRLAADYLAWDGSELLVAILWDGDRSYTEVIVTGLDAAHLDADDHAKRLQWLADDHRRRYYHRNALRPPIAGYALVTETFVLPAGPGDHSSVVVGEHALIVAVDSRGNAYSVRADRGDATSVEQWPPDPAYVDPVHERMRALTTSLAAGSEIGR
ncbi:hypothetical protein [Nocardia wallacei]|uniref:hypothetical protein n=1 Tax=Nocardia wallacei TaxID=480035 RepID=UPI0024564C27|nr:hypothetical protein [Nocardia wallacei]